MYFFKTETYFIGSFKNGEAVGEGIQYNIVTSQLYKGQVLSKKIDESSNAKPEILPNGKGIVILPNGEIIKGNFKNGKQL